MYVCQEYRGSLCTLWVVMYMCVRNIDGVSVPCEWSCICVSGTSMLSLFLVSDHVYMCQEYRCSLCSLLCGHVYVCQEYRCCLCSLLCGYVYLCQEYRCSLCSLWVVMYLSVRNIDVVSVPFCVVMYMCVRNIDVVSVPCEWSCISLSGISMLSLFLVSGYVYVCQEYRCSLCSLWVVVYMSVRNIDVVSVPCEW